MRRRESGFVLSGDKNPVFVESGRRGGRKRWGEQRVLRLDSLTTEQRRLVLALVDAARTSGKPDSGDEAA